MRRAVALLAFISLLVVTGPVWAGPLTASSPAPVSSEAASPLAACTEDDVDSQPGTNFANSEVEPWVDVNPTNQNNLVSTWQQDRWSNGASRGNLVGRSTDGGASWNIITETKTSACTGGPVEYTRASDPWVTFAPNGDVYLMTLATGTPATVSALPDLDAMLVSKSTDGGATWGDPIELIRDERATVFNDKNTMTADRNDADFVYAVWDRLVFPTERASRRAAENALAFRGPVLFTRTTDGGTSWEEPQVIFNPGQNNQTIGNQIAVLPDDEAFDGELVNIFNLIVNFREGRFFRGGRMRAAVIRSGDRGETWSAPIVIGDMRPVTTREPQEGTLVRDGNIIPDIAVDPDSGHLYAVWMDARFSSGNHNDIAFAMSTDGGLTWTSAVQVNQTPAGLTGNAGHAFTASVHVADDGTVGVSYYDFRNHDIATDASETDHFIVHCHNPDPADATDACADPEGWVETTITDSSFDLLQAPFAGGLFLGDYVGLTNVGNSFASVFTQSNSEEDPATEYFSSVPE